MIGVIVTLAVCFAATKFIASHDIPCGKCPKCGGTVKNEMYDMDLKLNVYKCECCGKEYMLQ